MDGEGKHSITLHMCNLLLSVVVAHFHTGIEPKMPAQKEEEKERKF